MFERPGRTMVSRRGRVTGLAATFLALGGNWGTALPVPATMRPLGNAN